MLFSEGKIGKLTLRNRVVMTAMDVSMANFDGTPSDALIRFYEERAKGGTGLIINGLTRVDDETGVAAVRSLGISSDDKIPAFKKMTDAVHAYGAKMFCQLHHPGRETVCALNGGKLLVSASGQACGSLCQPTRALTTEEVHDMVEKFVSAAVRAQKAGYDGVELHCAHGYLLQQFLSPYTNHRTDEYGGSRENRMRIVTEIIAGVRERCGNDFPISIRISVEEFLGPIGLTPEETVPMCVEFEKQGVDVINVSVGLYETGTTSIEPSSYPEGWRAPLIRAVKEAVSIPVMGVSVIRHPEFAEKLLEDGNQDFICMSRPHLADPEWVKKTQEGRENEIRQCLSCLRCFESYSAALGSGASVECAINPHCGHELEDGALQQDGNNRTVVVVGAGPAGMQAAQTLALRGFRPIVLEKENQVGGQMNIADKPFMKQRITALTATMKNELEKLGVEIRLGVNATAEDVQKLSPYAVIVATGGTPIVPSKIPGINNDNVYLCTDVLTGKVDISGKNVAVIGGGHTGLETAEFLAQHGNTVSIIEMASNVGTNMYSMNAADLIGRLKKLNVRFLTNRRLESIEGNTINLFSLCHMRPDAIEADCVVLSLGTVSNNALAEQLKGTVEKVITIGDAVTPGKIGNATRTAYLAAVSI